MAEFYTFPNRTMCSVLEEIRALDKTKNYSSLLSLIEELQSMGNRMEAALSDKKDIEAWTERRGKLKTEINDLIQKKEKLKRELGKRQK